MGNDLQFVITDLFFAVVDAGCCRIPESIFIMHQHQRLTGDQPAGECGYVFQPRTATMRIKDQC